MPKTRPLIRLLAGMVAILAGVSLIPGVTTRTLAASVTVTADYSQPIVTVSGFGCSIPWIAHGINDFSPQNQARILDALWSADKSGAGFSYVRIGTFLNHYNPNPGVYDWNHWSINGQMSLIKRLRAAYEIERVVASTWSPPGYMKDSGSAINGGRLLPGYYPQAAALMVDWLEQAQADLGMPIEVLSVQNEPNWSANYETCLYSPAEMTDFTANHLKPAMVNAGLSTKLMASESAWYNNFDNDWAYPMLNNATMRAALDIVATHAYGTSDLAVLSQACQQYNKPIWMTEDSEGEGVFDGSIADGQNWSSDIYKALNKGRFSAWFHWWGWSNGNNNGHLIYTPDTSTVIIPKRVYTIGHFSRFLRPGAVVVQSTSNNVGVESTTARTPDGLAVIVLSNTSSQSNTVSVSLQNLSSPPASLICYRTSGTEDQAQLSNVSVTSGLFTVDLPARSIVTLVDQRSVVPTNLAAFAASGTQIDLSWTGTSASSYNVKRSTTSGGPYTTIATNVTDTTYSDATATSGVRYYYVVSAVYSGSESLNSGEATPSLLHAQLAFDETSGGTAQDSTGNGWTGTLVNGPLWTSGNLGGAVDLDGIDDHVTLPTGIMSSLSEATIAAWVNLDAASTWSRVFDFGSGTSNYMFLTPNNGITGRVRFAITTGSGEQAVDGAAPLPTGVWTHVAVTLKGGTAILYVNGAPVGRNDAMTLTPASLGATPQNYIGKSQWADPYLNGRVDDVRIYSSAMSPGEVAALAAYQTTPPPPPPPPASTTVHVEAISVTTVSLSGGRKQGRTVVTILDNLGNPVPNATVSGTFSESINESQSAVTNASGVATLTTSASAKGKVRLTFCVSNVTHASLTYDSSANVETCDTSY